MGNHDPACPDGLPGRWSPAKPRGQGPRAGGGGQLPGCHPALWAQGRAGEVPAGASL